MELSGQLHSSAAVPITDVPRYSFHKRLDGFQDSWGVVGGTSDENREF
jgi:hypothetical protein